MMQNSCNKQTNRHCPFPHERKSVTLEQEDRFMELHGSRGARFTYSAVCLIENCLTGRIHLPKIWPGLSTRLAKPILGPMKVILFCVAVLAFVGPIGLWAYFAALAQMFNTSAPGRMPGLGDYWDREFLMIAILPWLISISCLVFAMRRK